MSWDSEPTSTPMEDLLAMKEQLTLDFMTDGYAFAAYRGLYIEITGDIGSDRCHKCGSRFTLVKFTKGFALLCPNACVRPDVVSL